ncbi:MAG: DUF362 domain-containing protein [Oscillospiraceae bacterium]|nr:DUF362 domain-containing protein [Oscillospiraceae bacterium]
MSKAKVYFTRAITPQSVVQMFELLNKTLPGRVAVKVHSGEKGNQNFLRPEFMKPAVERVGGTVVETNTAYKGERGDTPKHIDLLARHGWSRYFKVDVLDGEGPDMVLDIPGGKAIQTDYVGKGLANYDSMLVLSHFKGHPMGGFGGALKQLSIGCASAGGKAWIHTAGATNVCEGMWKKNAPQNTFIEAMADAALGVMDYFRGNTAFVNVVCNLSVDCDCCAVAEDPCMKDIGVLSSLDPVALDKACLDLIYAAKDDPGQAHFLERVESRNGAHIIEAAVDLGIGTADYELICVD